MEITKVTLFKSKREGAVQFYATVELDNTLVLKNLKILKNKQDNSLYVALPTEPRKNGEKTDYMPTMYYPKDGDKMTEKAFAFRQKLNDTLIEAANTYEPPKDTGGRKPIW